jgi:hypothetical protein
MNAVTVRPYFVVERLSINLCCSSFLLKCMISLVQMKIPKLVCQHTSLFDLQEMYLCSLIKHLLKS